MKTKYGKIQASFTLFSINYKLIPVGTKYHLYMRYGTREYKYMDKVNGNISNWKLSIYARKYVDTIKLLRK